MSLILAETVRRCIAEAAGATGPLGADSSGVETTRYENIEKPYKKERDFVEMRQKTYWKYHITAILGLQIVLATFTTPGNVNDVTMLPVMLAEIRRRGYDFSGSVFDADRGYDADYNVEELFWMGMVPNIKQRKDAVSRLLLLPNIKQRRYAKGGGNISGQGLQRSSSPASTRGGA